MKKHPRLAGSFLQRIRAEFFEPADIWIQAASAGEAFLAVCLVQHLAPARPVKVLVTTTTDQGMQILRTSLANNPCQANVSVSLSWFPFDRPPIVSAVVKRVNPHVMVLLETELWPALLQFLRQSRTRILVINGRMSSKSHQAYRWTRPLWSRVSPHRILAVSDRDARRYQQIFPAADVSVMPNIKFESMAPGPDESPPPGLEGVFPCPLPVTMLASIRGQEDALVLEMIRYLFNRFPRQMVAIFPRHLHRIDTWRKLSARTDHPVYLRSRITAPLTRPGIVLWDVFGEMRTAFSHAAAVFMGGSLKPLGGQNFMEPLLQGAPVVTGPFWDDFLWVGQAVFDIGLADRTPNWQAAADTLVHYLNHPVSRTQRQQAFAAYVTARSGGSDIACRAILAALSDRR